MSSPGKGAGDAPMSVSAMLLRIYRPIIGWIIPIVITVEVVAVTAILSVNPMPFSFWLVIVGAMAKYWPLVVGIMLITMHFRFFVTNGCTRREYLRGLAVFGLGVVLVAPAVVVVSGTPSRASCWACSTSAAPAIRCSGTATRRPNICTFSRPRRPTWRRAC